MAAKSPWHKIKVLCLLVLFVMILMRLIWMQLRTYSLNLPPCTQVAVAELGHERPEGCLSDESSSSNDDNVVLPKVEHCRGVSHSLFKDYLGYACRGGFFRPQVLVTYNQSWLVLVIILLTLAVRFQTSSWLLAMAVAAMLLSRGRLMGGLGTISPRSLIFVGLALWFNAYVHFLRTASLPSFLLSYIAMLGLAFLDPSFLGLFWAVPLTLLVSLALRRYTVKPKLRDLRFEQARLRQVTQGERDWEGERRLFGSRWFTKMRRYLGLDSDAYQDYETLAQRYQRGSLLRPLKVPFVLWAYRGRRSLKIFGLSLVVALLVTAVMLPTNVLPLAGPTWTISSDTLWQTGRQLFKQWFLVWPATIDLDMWMRLSFILLTVLLPAQRGFKSFWETSALLVMSLFMVSLAAFMVDWWQAVTGGLEENFWFFAAYGRSAQVLSWFEPVLLTFGMVAVVNAFRLVESVSQRPPGRRRAKLSKDGWAKKSSEQR